MTRIAVRMAELGLTNGRLAELAASSAHKISAARTGRYISAPLAVRLSEALGIDVQPCGSWEGNHRDVHAVEEPYLHTCEVCGSPSFRERCVGCYALLVPSEAETKELTDHIRSDAKRAYDKEYHQAVRKGKV